MIKQSSVRIQKPIRSMLTATTTIFISSISPSRACFPIAVNSTSKREIVKTEVYCSA